MTFPSITEYISAIRNAEDNFDKLHNLSPVLDSHGDPARSAGGFAVVFKLKDKDTGRLYAIKCFYEVQQNLKEAYGKISETLNKYNSPYILSVEYLDKEIYVNSSATDEKEFPVLKMEWLEGETMESFIHSNYRDSDAIRKLHDKFCKLALWLRSKPFAHGDIKPDNIMIRPEGTLTLIDYDGMYVPSMSGQKSPTLGTSGFSHPLRNAEDFDEHIDDFALAVLSISLLAMSEDTRLYENLCGKDRLLFSREDYFDFENSNAYNQIKQLGGLFPSLLNLLAKCISDRNKNSIALYDQIFDLQTKAPEILSFECVNGYQIYKGDDIELTWNVDNATFITINGKNVTDFKKFKFKADKICEFELKVSNGLKESKKSIVLDVIDTPVIKFKASSTKLRKGKDKNVRFTWSTKNAYSTSLQIGNSSITVPNEGERIVEFDKETEVKLLVTGLDQKRIFSKLQRINIFTESNVEFSSDKQYSMPGVPIRLTWDVSHAKKVHLMGFGDVKPQDSIVVEPTSTTIYKLKVDDAFGQKEYSIKIQMLPLPQIKINVPTPNLSVTTDVDLKIPPPTYAPTFPNVNIMGVEMKAPFVPSLEEAGLNVKLSNRLIKQINLWADIKSIYYYYRKKILNYD